MRKRKRTRRTQRFVVTKRRKLVRVRKTPRTRLPKRSHHTGVFVRKYKNRYYWEVWLGGDFAERSSAIKKRSNALKTAHRVASQYKQHHLNVYDRTPEYRRLRKQLGINGRKRRRR